MSRARDQAIVRAQNLNAPEDRHVEAICETFGYGAVMDASARLWARKDPRGAFYVAGECLGSDNLEAEAQAIRERALDDLASAGQGYDKEGS